MKRLLVTLSLVVILSAVKDRTLASDRTVLPTPASYVLAEYSWPQRDPNGAPTDGQVLPPDESTPFVHLKLYAPQGQSRTFTVMTIDKPAITAEQYALTGWVKYNDVQQAGRLEMWTRLPDGSRYFTRTFNTAGPLASLTGSSDWRQFTLTFLWRPTHPEMRGAVPDRPIVLDVKVVLPAGGTVYLSPLKLVQHPDYAIAAQVQSAHAWWDGPTVGKIGGVWGIAMGLFGGLIGTLGGLGRARRLVLTLLVVMFGLGVLALILAVIAILQDQPVFMLYPLLLAGILNTILPGALYYPLTKRYEDMELRKMEALDVH